MQGDRTSTAAEIEGRRAIAFIAAGVAERLHEAIEDERDPIHQILLRRGAVGTAEGEPHVPVLRIVYDNKAAQDSMAKAALDPGANLQYATAAAEAAMAVTAAMVVMALAVALVHMVLGVMFIAIPGHSHGVNVGPAMVVKAVQVETVVQVAMAVMAVAALVGTAWLLLQRDQRILLWIMETTKPRAPKAMVANRAVFALVAVAMAPMARVSKR